MDEEKVTPADFGVMLKNLPRNKTPDELKQWLSAVIPGIEIVYVNYCFNIRKMVKVVRKLTGLQQTKIYWETYKEKKLKKLNITEDEATAKGISLYPKSKKWLCITKYSDIDQLITKVQFELDDIKQKMEVSNRRGLYCGTAFVVCNRPTNTNVIIDRFRASFVRRIITFVMLNLFCCKFLVCDKRVWEGKMIHAEKATEPGDIYWENLPVTKIERLIKRTITIFVSFLVISITFVINYFLSILKQSLEDGDDSTRAKVTIRIISIVMSLIVVITNFVLSKVIRILASFEKQETYTKYHRSVASKLSISMFINTAIVPIVVNASRDDWFRPGGLMVDIFYNALSISFISPILYFFTPGYFVKKLRVWLEEKKGDNSKMTQKQANALFEGPPLDMAQRYANTLFLFSLTVFYVLPFPLISLIAF